MFRSLVSARVAVVLDDCAAPAKTDSGMTISQVTDAVRGRLALKVTTLADQKALWKPLPRTSSEDDSPGKQRERATAHSFCRGSCPTELWLIVRRDVYDVRLVFAHRAFCATEILLRAAAERVRLSFFGFVRKLVRWRPTKLPMTWITWSSRPRSFSSSSNTPARSTMYSPSCNNCPYILQINRYRRQAIHREIACGSTVLARNAIDIDALHCRHAWEISNYRRAAPF
jgi:hypothetical protein